MTTPLTDALIDEKLFVEPSVWPPNSPDLNPVDYAIWGPLQEMVYTIVKVWPQLMNRCAMGCFAVLSVDVIFQF